MTTQHATSNPRNHRTDRSMQFGPDQKEVKVTGQMYPLGNRTGRAWHRISINSDPYNSNGILANLEHHELYTNKLTLRARLWISPSSTRRLARIMQPFLDPDSILHSTLASGVTVRFSRKYWQLEISRKEER